MGVPCCRVNPCALRQGIVPDNQRWGGNVGWRQNEQTFDAIELRWRPTAALTVRYDWLDMVHRVASDRALNPLPRERNLDTHLLNVAWARGASLAGASGGALIQIRSAPPGGCPLSSRASQSG